MGVILGCCAVWICLRHREALALAGGNRRELKAVLSITAGFTEIPGCLFPDRQYALALFGR